MTDHEHEDAAPVSRQTWVSLGTAVMLIVALIGATVWITDRLGELEGQIQRLEQQTSDQYTLAQAAEHALRTAMANPGLTVPDPRNPGKYFRVDTRDGPESGDTS